MTDFRFQFLQRDFPALAALCEQAERADDLHTALLKMRMALENMVNDMGAKQKELFGKINELNDQGILDAKRSQLFHQVRRTSNLGVHEGNEIGTADIKACLDALFEITLWYAISFKKKHYELAAFQTADMGLVKQYLNDHAPEDKKSASSEQAQDFFSNSIDPLQVDGDFFRQMEKNQEADKLNRDVFETDEEYAKRIAAMPKVHLGYAILDARRQDGYTKIVFALHHIDRNDRIHFSHNIRAFYAENIIGNDVIDNEIVGGLRVFDGQVYCNYSTIVLKHGNEEIPLHPICWERFPYESDMDFQHRITQMPVLPLGLCLPDRNSYDIHTEMLTFVIRPFIYVKEKLTLPDISLKIDRDLAKELCAQNHPYKMFGRFEGDDVLFVLWDKEVGVFYDGLNMHGGIGKQTKEQSEDNAEKFIVPDLSAEKMVQLGETYLKGIGVPKDIGKGVECYKKAAEKGSLKAQLDLGDRYRRGIDVEKDEREAFRWYWQAAGQGNADAQFWIGCSYNDGDGVKQDYKEAMKWYRKAAEQDNADAQRNIGYLYYNGDGVKEDDEEAVKWLKKAMIRYRKIAEQGDADAQFNIGYLYYNGAGVKQDYKEGMKWYRKAAEQGNTDAQTEIGYCYYWGRGVKKDYEEAVKWYRKAAEHGDAIAQCNMGFAYRVGHGVKKDYEEAMKWYHKAAEQGDSSAQRAIGILYEYGLGVKKDYEEAMKWYRKAAEQGDRDAQCIIGDLYYNGRGVKQDYEEAMKWYRKAAEQGSFQAKSKLEEMQKKSSATDISKKESSGCFITTAVCKCFGKPDDCYELTMFRGFRDNWLAQQPDGEALVAEYYAIAPTIVNRIDQMVSSADIYQQIWQRYLAPCLKHLEQGENEACKERYIDMVRTLKAQYC